MILHDSGLDLSFLKSFGSLDVNWPRFGSSLSLFDSNMGKVSDVPLRSLS